jgi:hypothetical protein
LAALCDADDEDDGGGCTDDPAPRITTTGKFSIALPNPNPASQGDSQTGLLRILRQFFSSLCVDHRAEELARLKAELAERERQMELEAQERERRRREREKAQLLQALQASEERSAADKADYTNKLAIAEERAATAVAKAAALQAELDDIKLRNEAALKDEEQKRVERERQELEIKREKEFEALQKEYRVLKDEQLRLAEYRRLAEIEEINLAQQTARVGLAALPTTPAVDPHSRTYDMLEEAVESDPTRFVPPLPRRPEFGSNIK